MLRIEYVYWLCGAILAACAARDVGARRTALAAFWGILAASFLGGDVILAAAESGNVLPAQLAGVGVIALALIAGSGKLHRRTMAGSEASAQARISTPNQGGSIQLGNRLFAPALVIPLGTLVIVLLQPYLHFGGSVLIDPHQATLTALALACVIAALAAAALTRAAPVTALEETSRLLNALSWAALLPMLLATLGAVFAAAGVGEAVAHVVAAMIPPIHALPACSPTPLAWSFSRSSWAMPSPRSR